VIDLEQLPMATSVLDADVDERPVALEIPAQAAAQEAGTEEAAHAPATDMPIQKAGPEAEILSSSPLASQAPSETPIAKETTPAPARNRELETISTATHLHDSPDGTAPQLSTLAALEGPMQAQTLVSKLGQHHDPAQGPHRPLAQTSPHTTSQGTAEEQASSQQSMKEPYPTTTQAPARVAGETPAWISSRKRDPLNHLSIQVLDVPFSGKAPNLLAQIFWNENILARLDALPEHRDGFARVLSFYAKIPADEITYMSEFYEQMQKRYPGIENPASWYKRTPLNDIGNISHQWIGCADALCNVYTKTGYHWLDSSHGTGASYLRCGSHGNKKLVGTLSSYIRWMFLLANSPL
jgi:hypothetical protein